LTYSLSNEDAQKYYKSGGTPLNTRVARMFIEYLVKGHTGTVPG